MINLITDLINFTQPTNLDKESLSLIESVAKIKKVVNECINQFNALENKTNEDYKNFLNQITIYKNEVIKIINDIKNDNKTFKNEFREIIESIETFNTSLNFIIEQSKYVQELALYNQKQIDKGTVLSKGDIQTINVDSLYFTGSTDDERLTNAISVCKQFGYCLEISRMLKLTSPITTFDFSFNIKGLNKDSGFKYIGETDIECFFDITAPTGVIYPTRIESITIEGNSHVEYVTWLRKGKANNMYNVTIKGGTHAQLYIGYNAENKVIEFTGHKLYLIGGELTEGATLSQYNLITNVVCTDAHFYDVLCCNSSEANVLDYGWSNSYNMVHCYGYPYENCAKTCMFINSNFGTYSNIQCDTFKMQGLYITGHYITIDNIKIQNNLSLYPESGGIKIYTQNDSSTNININNITMKPLDLNDKSNKFAFDIFIDGKYPKTLNIGNIANQIVPYDKRITNMFKRVIRIPQGETQVEMKFPYEFDDNNYIVTYNCYDYTVGNVKITSKGTSSLWFSCETPPTDEYGASINVIIEYQRNVD